MIDFTTYNWAEITGAGRPNVSQDFSVAWVGDGMLLYGGSGLVAPFYYTETWKLVVPGDTWTQLFPANNPGPREGAAMAYNPDDQYVLLFGGYDLLNSVRKSDTWKYDIATANWTNLNPVTSPTITSDYAALSTTMGYVGGGVFQLHSQHVVAGLGVSQLSSFNGTNWTNTTPASDPAANQGFNLLSAPASGVLNGKFTIFGGGTNSQPALDLSTAYATHEYTAGDWAIVTNAVHPNPFPNSVATSHPFHTRDSLRYGMASTGTQAVLFGGHVYDIGILGTFSVGDTWTLDSTGWGDLSKTGPGHRYVQGMVWDDINLRFLMYGGYTENPTIRYTDTWQFFGPFVRRGLYLRPADVA